MERILLQGCIVENSFEEGLPFLLKLMSKGDRTKSSIRNLFLVSLSIDVSILDYHSWLNVIHFINKWESNREDPNLIINAYKYLAEAKKCNIYEKIADFYDINDKIPLPKKGVGSEFYKEGDDRLFKRLLDGFVNSLNKKDYTVYAYYQEIIHYQGTTGSRERRTKKVWVVMDILKTYIKLTPLYEEIAYILKTYKCGHFWFGMSLITLYLKENFLISKPYEVPKAIKKFKSCRVYVGFEERKEFIYKNLDPCLEEIWTRIQSKRVLSKDGE